LNDHDGKSKAEKVKLIIDFVQDFSVSQLESDTAALLSKALSTEQVQNQERDVPSSRN